MWDQSGQGGAAGAPGADGRPGFVSQDHTTDGGKANLMHGHVDLEFKVAVKVGWIPNWFETTARSSRWRSF